MTWTLYFDYASGGYRKTEYSTILIEGSESNASKVFKDRFKISPYGMACSCCGEDFNITEYDSLEDAMKHVSPSEKILKIPQNSHSCIRNRTDCYNA